MEGFCVTSLGRLYLEGAYFRNFTVCKTNTSGVPPLSSSSFLRVFFSAPLFISRHYLLCERMEQARTVLIR